MVLSVQIRGPSVVVRRRTGEWVSDPVQEYEDGEAPAVEVLSYDDRLKIGYYIPTDIETVTLPVEMRGAATADKLVAATSAFSSQSQAEQNRDPEKIKEHQRRAELDRLPELRHVLSKLHEKSMLARPAKQTFIQRTDTGIAKATFQVWRGALTIGATVQSFAGVASHLAQGAGASGSGARLRGEGQLAPDGSIDKLRLDVELDGIPSTGPVEQANLDRLKRDFVRMHSEGIEQNREARTAWRRDFGEATERRPETPLMLLGSMLTDLQRQAAGLLDSKPSGQPSMMTLHDLLETAGEEEPANQEVDLSDETRMVWVDDKTPALDIPGCETGRLDILNALFRGVLAYLPQAWSLPRPAPASAPEATAASQA